MKEIGNTIEKSTQKEELRVWPAGPVCKCLQTSKTGRLLHTGCAWRCVPEEANWHNVKATTQRIGRHKDATPEALTDWNWDKIGHASSVMLQVVPADLRRRNA